MDFSTLKKGVGILPHDRSCINGMLFLKGLKKGSYMEHGLGFNGPPLLLGGGFKKSIRI